MTDGKLGRYTLLEKISSGGMGDVYLAVSPGASGLFKFVALKKVHDEFMSKPETRRFFENEGKIGLHLSHSNLVQMYEASSVGKDFFFVMEYINGITLGTLLKKLHESRQTLPVNLLFNILIEFANALAYIHSYTNPAFNIHAGIIHQDISANNVMVDFNGRVKIIDFGIAKPQSYEEKSSLIVGKLGYMSPEQLTRQQVTHRSDIYSFGVTMWELVSGVRLFAGAETEVINKKKMKGQVPPLSQHNPDVPQGLQAIVSRCLKLNPADRYDSMTEVIRDLYEVMNREGISYQGTPLADYLEKEFRFEKQTNAHKLRQYSQDIMSSKLKIDAAATDAAVEEKTQESGPAFTEIISASPAGKITQRKFTLVFEKACVFAHVGIFSREEVLVEGMIPKNFWGQRCMMLFQKTKDSLAQSYWVYVSSDGKRLHHSQQRAAVPTTATTGVMDETNTMLLAVS
jgi:serine/threonine protein kinase